MTDAECVSLLQWALPRLGLRWPGFRRVRRQVCKRVSRRMAELGMVDVAGYRARLEADPGEWEVLDRCCWISVSRFCRDRGVFEHLTDALLPELARAVEARGERTLRVWSAGCASGEEPYGLRLAWDLEVARSSPDVELRIVASDASSPLLERARRGVYPASALREVPEAWRAAAFEEIDGEWRLRPEFRRGVELHQQDIRKQMPDGPFDLILCRNLAFTYFDRDLQREILAALVARLAPGGALLVGSHETLPEPSGLAPSHAVPGLHRLGPG